MLIPAETNKKSRFLHSAAILMLALMTLATVLPVKAAVASYRDVPDSSPYYPYITYLSGLKLASGFPDGTFHPGESITRAEITVMLARGAGLTARQPDTPTFTDVAQDHWARGYIEAAVAAGILKGYPDGAFRPDSPVSRAEAACLVLGLSGKELPATPMPGNISDVDTGYWAANQIAASLDAGLFDQAEAGKFAPDQPATRAQAAKALAVMLTIMPGREPLPLTGILKPVEGKVLLKLPGLEYSVIDTAVPCPVGSEIKTGPNARADLNFPDGSGLRIEPNTQVAIKQGQGQPAILRDGSPGTLVDYLEFSVSEGKVFGALAAGYNHREKAAEPTASLNGASHLRKNLLATTAMTGEFLPAQAGQNSGAGESNLSWWEVPQSRPVRVQVDMPWGVAGVRGTFWMTRVSGSSNDLSVVDGSARLSAAGGSQNVGAGMASFITGPGNTPSQAGGMPDDLKNDWAGAEQWVRQRAQAIQNSLPASSPPGPGTAGGILRSYNNSLYGPAPLEATGFSPADGSTGVLPGQTVTVTFNANLQKGDDFSSIILQGPGGEETAADIAIRDNTLLIDPVGSLAQSVPVSGEIVLDFDLPLVEEQSSINLAAGGNSITLPASIKGARLTAPYSGLTYGTTYTVTIPRGAVESLDHGTENDEMSWTFTTRPEPR